MTYKERASAGLRFLGRRGSGVQIAPPRPTSLFSAFISGESCRAGTCRQCSGPLRGTLILRELLIEPLPKTVRTASQHLHFRLHLLVGKPGCSVSVRRNHLVCHPRRTGKMALEQGRGLGTGEVEDAGRDRIQQRLAATILEVPPRRCLLLSGCPGSSVSRTSCSQFQGNLRSGSHSARLSVSANLCCR